MPLEIGRSGIVLRYEDGTTAILRPDRSGGPAEEIEVPAELADAHRLAAGDIVACETEPVNDAFRESPFDESSEMAPGWDEQIDEPADLRPGPYRHIPARRRIPTRRLTRVSQINGLDLEAAEERPSARSKRSRSERVAPDRLLVLVDGPDDATGRSLDFAAPLGTGVFGIVYGPHGGGLSRTLQAVHNGVSKSAPDVVVLVLMLRQRAEETTEWRRRISGAEIVVASSALSPGDPHQTLQLCDLVLEAAQRQTELGRDVLLLVDSLTALWATMLEAEEADAQREADTSAARQRMREWTQRAGCFHGEAPLGGGLGGSLTILGSVWHQAINEEAEEERDTHPHLRLMEHVLPEASWQAALSEILARRRLYPAVDVKRCRSQVEEALLPPEIAERLLTVRGALPRNHPVACHLALMDAIDASADLPGLLDALSATDMDALIKSLAPPERPAAPAVTLPRFDSLE